MAQRTLWVQILILAGLIQTLPMCLRINQHQQALPSVFIAKHYQALPSISKLQQALPSFNK